MNEKLNKIMCLPEHPRNSFRFCLNGPNYSNKRFQDGFALMFPKLVVPMCVLSVKFYFGRGLVVHCTLRTILETQTGTQRSFVQIAVLEFDA